MLSSFDGVFLSQLGIKFSDNVLKGDQSYIMSRPFDKLTLYSADWTYGCRGKASEVKCVIFHALLYRTFLIHEKECLCLSLAFVPCTVNWNPFEMFSPEQHVCQNKT